MPRAVFNPNNYLIWDLDRYGVTIKLDNAPGGIPAQLISCSQLQLIQRKPVESNKVDSTGLRRRIDQVRSAVSSSQS